MMTQIPGRQGVISASVMLLAGALLPLGAAHASADPMIENARLCTQNFPVEERKNNIPTHLLAAIATTESGVWHKDLGMAVPWPWTINVEGKGYHFDSKAEAIAQTQRFLRQGRQSIDVGCMQVNLKHHANAFRNLEEAFDPKTNVAYAAKFLSTNYAEMGNWIKATAAYHSRTEARGKIYLAQIEKSWNKIVSKVAAARAATGSSAGVKKVEVASAEPSPDATRTTLSKKPTMRPIRETHNVRLIKVSDRTSQVSSATIKRQNNVMIIRPSVVSAPGETQIAQAVPVPEVSAAVAQAPADSTVQGTDSVRRVSLSSPQPTGAKFVFAN